MTLTNQQQNAVDLIQRFDDKIRRQAAGEDVVGLDSQVKAAVDLAGRGGPYPPTLDLAHTQLLTALTGGVSQLGPHAGEIVSRCNSQLGPLLQAFMSSPAVAPPNVIFESNFNDIPTGSLGDSNGLDDKTGFGSVNQWSGFKNTSGSEWEVRAGAGIGGSNAMVAKYNPGQAQPTLKLVKHFGDTTFYPEIYVRMELLLVGPGGQGFKVSSGGGNNGFLKLGRAWQRILHANKWSEGYDAGPPEQLGTSYIVPNLSHIKIGGLQRPKFLFAQSWKGHADADSTEADSDPPISDPTDGSVNGPRVNSSFSSASWNLSNPASGFLESHTGEQDANGVLPSGLSWLVIEYRLKLATPGQADGIFQLWVNGVEQTPITSLEGRSLNKLPTVAERAAAIAEVGAASPGNRLWTENVAGLQAISLLDNNQGIASEWGVEQHEILVNSFVVATSPIGTTYAVAG